jgi:hypothetical protein
MGDMEVMQPGVQEMADTEETAALGMVERVEMVVMEVQAGVMGEMVEIVNEVFAP